MPVLIARGDCAEALSDSTEASTVSPSAVSSGPNCSAEPLAEVLSRVEGRGGMRGIEGAIRRRGFCRLAGVDEAGRGALAGPVVAAAVILRDGRAIPGVTDSKRLSAERRERLYQRIVDEALAVAVGVVEVPIIELRNILQATLLAMERAVAELRVVPDGIVVDGLAVPRVEPAVFPVPGGDLQCPSISAASIVAKVTRDRMMRDYHQTYPAYGFDRHKGYGTEAHLRAILEHGLSPIHRRTFVPVRQIPLPLVAAGRQRC